MKHPKDSGASPAARFKMMEKKNVIRLLSSDVIKFFADYDKSKPVQNRKIWIQEMGEFLWFKINDVEWAHKLNNTRVRVRMWSQAPNVIYLFDAKTDTYLTFVVREFETAGDVANATGEDWGAIHEHLGTIEEMRAFRKEQLDTVISEIENEEKNDAPLPESFKEVTDIVLNEPRQHFKDQPDNSENEKPEKSKRSRRTLASSIDQTENEIQINEDTVSPDMENTIDIEHEEQETTGIHIGEIELVAHDEEVVLELDSTE